MTTTPQKPPRKHRVLAVVAFLASLAFAHYVDLEPDPCAPWRETVARIEAGFLTDQERDLARLHPLGSLVAVAAPEVLAGPPPEGCA